MKENKLFKNLSLTHLKQELSIVKTILAQLEYSETKSKVSIQLDKFRGKHFRDFSSEQLVNRVLEVLIRFKKHNLISTFKKSGPLLILSLKNKVKRLENYKNQLEKEISKQEADLTILKSHSGKFCWLVDNNKTFFIKNIKNQPKTIPLRSSRKTTHMSCLFTIFFNHWEMNGEKLITNQQILRRAKDMCQFDPNLNWIKNTVNNIRNQKIPESLQKYIKFKPSRGKGGWIISIQQPQ